MPILVVLIGAVLWIAWGALEVICYLLAVGFHALSGLLQGARDK